MKIVKFDRSFSSRAITDEVFFFLFLSFLSLSLSLSRSTQRNTPIPIAFRRGSRFIPPAVPSRPTEVPFILLQESWLHQPSARRRVIRYRGTTVLVRRSFATSASLPIRGGGWGLVYTTTRLFSLFLFFLAADKWYSYVLRKPRLRVVKSP